MKRLGNQRWGARILAGLALALALASLAPMPNFAIWMAHLVLLELSLAISALGVIALMLGFRVAPWSSAAAGAAVLVGVLPLLRAIPAFVREGQRFSLLEYVRGIAAEPGSVQYNLVLDPSWPNLTADLYRPRSTHPSPLVVAIHGGSWHGGEKGQAAHVSRFLASRGYAVLDVSYRLAPAHPFPAAIGDVKCLLGRFRQRAAKFGIDPNRVALLGRSAGGEIALVAGYSAGDARLPPSCPIDDQPVRAVISIYGATDLVDAYERPVRPDLIDARRALEDFLQGSPRQRPEAYRMASAVSWLGQPLPPTLLIHGERDGIVRSDHSPHLAKQLTNSGHRVRLLMIPLADHGFDERPGGIGEQLSRAVILDFLKKQLNADGSGSGG